MSRRSDTDRLYALLAGLAEATEGTRLLCEATASTGWPTHGVYFFFERGELRLDGQPRVVRVGTHALTQRSRSTLWTRLSQHRGQVGGSNPGGGNHRGSIFRLHVGAALIARGDVADLPLSAWLAARPAPEHRDAERACERQVSAYIGQMPVLCLPVPNHQDGTSDRGLIETTCIALLSVASGGIDPASPTWLGRYASNPAIAGSGLWNVRHVTDSYHSDGLALLQQYVTDAAACRL